MRISDWSSDVCSSDLLNVFASWCIPCIAESPQLMRLKAMGVPIEGVAVRDTPENTDIFLRRYGNPFVAVGDDRDGRRSEEHTSELQSLMRISYAVFCLKKKTHQHTSRQTYVEHGTPHTTK